jgi:hypothetical protein
MSLSEVGKMQVLSAAVVTQNVAWTPFVVANRVLIGRIGKAGQCGRISDVLRLMAGSRKSPVRGTTSTSAASTFNFQVF